MSQRIEMKCHYCGGQLEKGKTEYNSPVGITIRGVPALVCANCGKAYITGQVAEILDKIEDFAEERLKEATAIIAQTET